MYYELMGSKRRIRPVHPNEIPALIRLGRTVYYARENPKICYHPRYTWIACWLDPKSLRAAEIELRARGYNIFAERSMRRLIRWKQSYYSKPPRETIRPMPTDPGRLWIQVRVSSRFATADANEKEVELGRAAEAVESASSLVRVAKNPGGEIVHLTEPPVGLARREMGWSEGDLIYVPSRKMWGRFWSTSRDGRHIELGPVHIPTSPIDEISRVRNRAKVVPSAWCVRVPSGLGSGSGVGSGRGIAQAKGKSGSRWSTDQVASMG